MKKLYAAFLLLGTFGLNACNSDDDVQNTTPSGPYAGFVSLLNSNGAPAQTFVIDADTGGTFVGARGTRFAFEPRSFARPNGDTNVHGSVRVTVQEFLDRGEMIYNRVLPISSSSYLRTTGAFFAAATQSNLSVKLKPGSFYAVLLPQRNFINDGAGLQAYFGSQYDGYVSRVLWTPSTRPASIASTAPDTVAMLVDTFGFHMAAAPNDFFDVSTATKPEDIADIKFNINGPSGVNEGNSYLYLLPKGLRQIIPLGGAGDLLKNKKFRALVGKDLNLVAIAVVNGEFYGTAFTGKTEGGKTYTLNLNQADPVAFKTVINQLL